VPVPTGDHRKAGETALRCLGLKHDGNSAPSFELETSAAAVEFHGGDFCLGFELKFVKPFEEAPRC
jgi:hypothetical protein